jgi:formylglycine-generating enzyme required for sulfatase activity
LDAYYSVNAIYNGPCTDCADLTDNLTRLLRGGVFASSAPALLAAAIDFTGANFRNSQVGLRCARTP